MPVWLPHGGTICTFGCFHKTCGRQREPCCCNVGKGEARAIWRFAWNKKRTGTRRAVPTKTLPARNARANACERYTAAPWKKFGKPHLGLRLAKSEDGGVTAVPTKMPSNAKNPLQTPVSGIRPCLGRSLASRIWDSLGKTKTGSSDASYRRKRCRRGVPVQAPVSGIQPCL